MHGRPFKRGRRLLAALDAVDRLEVPLHVTLLVKGGGAGRARVRPRPAVDAHVPLQVVLLVAAVETLAAGGARGEGGAGGGVALLPSLQDKATLRPPPALPPPLRTTLHTPGPCAWTHCTPPCTARRGTQQLLQCHQHQQQQCHSMVTLWSEQLTKTYY